MVLQAVPDLRVTALGNAQDMLTGPLGLAFLLFHFHKLFCLGMADRAFCGRVFAFVYVSAHQASEFLFHVLLI
jgi:hypothetical protein